MTSYYVWYDTSDLALRHKMHLAMIGFHNYFGYYPHQAEVACGILDEPEATIASIKVREVEGISKFCIRFPVGEVHKEKDALVAGDYETSLRKANDLRRQQNDLHL